MGCWEWEEATLEAIGCLQRFEPFGRGNPRPRFLLDRVRLTAPPRAVGASGAHLQMQFCAGGFLGKGDCALRPGRWRCIMICSWGLNWIWWWAEDLIHSALGGRVDFIIGDIARSDGEVLRVAAEG